MILPPSSDAVRPRRHARRANASVGAVDYRAEFRPLYTGSDKRVEVVHAPRMNYLAIDGSGDPRHGAAFRDAATLLDRLSAEVRATVSRRGVMELAPMPLECIWWSEGEPAAADSTLRWTVMVMQPVVSPALLDEVLAATPCSDLAPATAPGAVRLVRFYEGPAAQTLSRSAVPCCPEALARIRAFAMEQGYRPNGPLHEIVLDGFPGRRTTRPQHLLRQPVAPS